MWQVVLIKGNVSHIWGKDYFPRKMRYKADALKLQAKVRQQGADAKVERVTLSAWSAPIIP
jgi:hypothetical protein